MGVLKKPQKISKKTPREPKLAVTAEPPRVFQFGSFLLDQNERILLRDGKPVSLTPKVFDILSALVRSAGRMVTKDALLREVWPDAFVEEANLSVNIATLRKALGQEQYIETVAKHGYRFVAEVVEIDSGIATPAERKKRPASHRATDKYIFNSLAVLPFHNESADPNAEYLSDGLTESIINSTSQHRNLRVLARNTVFRYRSPDMDPQEVGRELGVSAVLFGRILQLGDKLIVRTELIDVLNGWQMWGEQYYGQLSDILTVQEKISGAISEKLKVKLSREEKELFSKRHTGDAEAFRLYLKGRYYWNKYTEPGLRKAIEYFEQAIEIDPTYAVAYAGLADSYYRLSNVYMPTREAMPKAQAAALRALEIDETLSEAHASLGLINLFYDWDWSVAAVEFRKAIQSNPGNALAHQRFGLYLNLLGRFDEAERQIKQAAALDPLSPQIQSGLGGTFLLSRRYHRAIEEARKALEMDDSYGPALYLMGRAYEGLGRHDEAIAAFNKALSLNPAPMFLAGLGHVYAVAGKSRLARKVLRDLERQSAERYVSEYNKAVIHLALGDRERTFACLERACEERCEMMTWIRVDPFFDSIRTDIRFANLLRRIGLGEETSHRIAAR